MTDTPNRSGAFLIVPLGVLCIPFDACHARGGQIGREVTLADLSRPKGEHSPDEVSDLLELMRAAAELAELDPEGDHDSSATVPRGTQRNSAETPFLSCSEQEPRRTLTTAEAAKRTGLTERYMRELAHHGDVEAARRGSAWAIDADSLDAWNASRRPSRRIGKAA